MPLPFQTLFAPRFRYKTIGQDSAALLFYIADIPHIPVAVFYKRNRFYIVKAFIDGFGIAAFGFINLLPPLSPFTVQLLSHIALFLFAIIFAYCLSRFE